MLDLPIDSANHQKLTLRENRGRIPDRASLESLLEKAIHRELDAEKPIVIIYHPGKDALQFRWNRHQRITQDLVQ
ncbi:MAG: hypothetical protein R2778_02680 [Saprospiraceae bacterium]